MNTFYLPASGQVLLASQLYQNTGFSPNADPSVLASNGIYTVIPADNPCDPYLYNAVAVYIVAGNYANQSWTCDPYPLPTAKTKGSFEAKQTANAAVDTTVCDCGYTTDLLVGVAGQDPLDRPARYQAELDEMVAISNQLDSDLTSIDNATSVDEINAIVHKPYGVINTGRGGPGQAGPRDLNLSYFTEINDLPGFTQADLELYVPGTNTVISYTDSLPEPFHFDSAGNCFNTNDWRLVIRYAGGGAVISTITVPQGANVDVPWVYNPVIPSSGSSSSSQK